MPLEPRSLGASVLAMAGLLEVGGGRLSPPPEHLPVGDGITGPSRANKEGLRTETERLPDVAASSRDLGHALVQQLGSFDSLASNKGAQPVD